jgi:hypothetical protein
MDVDDLMSLCEEAAKDNPEMLKKLRESTARREQLDAAVDEMMLVGFQPPPPPVQVAPVKVIEAEPPGSLSRLAAAMKEEEEHYGEEPPPFVARIPSPVPMASPPAAVAKRALAPVLLALLCFALSFALGLLVLLR